MKNHRDNAEIRRALGKNDVHFAFLLAMQGDASSEVIDIVISACLNQGRVEDAYDLARRFRPSRCLTSREVDIGVGVCVRNGWERGAMHAARIGGRDLTYDELDILTDPDRR